MVESGEGGVELDSYWKKKEAFLRGSAVSLGDKFSSGTLKMHHHKPEWVSPEKAFTLAIPNLLSFTCSSISHALYLRILMRHISLSTNVLLSQQFSFIHHVPPGFSLTNGFKCPH